MREGTLILFIDYREFNKFTIKSKYHLLQIDDLFDQLWGAKISSQFDVSTKGMEDTIKKQSQNKE